MVLVVGAFTLPPVLLPDAPFPASVAPWLAGARDSAWDHATDDLRLPLHLRFVTARCTAGGRVAVIFEEWRPPYLGPRYSIAMRGSMPTDEADAWGGAVGVRSWEDDNEFVYQMGTEHRACN